MATRAWREGLIARGLCQQGERHGPATRGLRCAACAQYDVRRKRLVLSRDTTAAFWAAMRDWYADGGRRMLH
jgi:hypothetical protein